MIIHEESLFGSGSGTAALLSRELPGYARCRKAARCSRT
jgi:hypothetical protein